jgi:hypothetical protein
LSPRPIKDTRPPLWRRPLFVVLAIVLVVVIVGGTAILVSGSGGSNGTTPGGFALTATIDNALVGSVACWSPSSCVAVGSVGNEGEIWFLTAGKVVSSNAVTGTVRLVSVACAGGAHCVAGGRGVGSIEVGSSVPSVGAIVAIDNGAIGSAARVGSVQVVTGVACWSATGCAATANATTTASAIVLLSSGLVIAVRPVSASSGTFESIACGAPSVCEIASFLNPQSAKSAGVLVSLDNGQVGKPEPVAHAYGMLGIACATSTHCVGVGLMRTKAPSDFEGVFVYVTSGHPGVVATVANTGDFFSVSCLPSRCEAVGAEANDKGGVGTAITGNAAGNVLEAGSTSLFSGVACPTADSCVVVGHAGANSVVEKIDPSGAASA